MKKVEIRQFAFAEVDAPKETFGFLKIPAEHTLIRAEGERLEVSDGYHTFDELYDHRITLYIALCGAKSLFDNKYVWRSKRHFDGELCFGTGTQFVLGIGYRYGEQITYHIPIERWDEANFAITRVKAPEWDGHTPADVIERLKQL
jgi:hypothetical protein